MLEFPSWMARQSLPRLELRARYKGILSVSLYAQIQSKIHHNRLEINQDMLRWKHCKFSQSCHQSKSQDTQPGVRAFDGLLGSFLAFFARRRANSFVNSQDI